LPGPRNVAAASDHGTAPKPAAADAATESVTRASARRYLIRGPRPGVCQRRTDPIGVVRSVCVRSLRSGGVARPQRSSNRLRVVHGLV
jgi:hypothetical protein